MGCTESSAVQNPNKIKSLTTEIEKPFPSSNPNNPNENILIGQIENGKYFYANVILPTNVNQQIEIRQKELPMLVNLSTQQNNQNSAKLLKLPNFAQMTQMPNHSHIYIITGGINYKLDNIYDSTYLFDIKNNKIYKIAELNQARYTHSAIYTNGSLYVMGGRYFGEDDEAILGTCQKIDLNISINEQNNNILQVLGHRKYEWKEIANMNIKRCSQISVFYNNKIYAIGGYTSECQRSPAIQYYDTNLKQKATWQILNVQLPFGIQSSFALPSINIGKSEITIFGGNCNSGPIDSVLTLNLQEGKESIRSNKKLMAFKILHKGYHSPDKGVIYILGGNQNMDIEIYQYNRKSIQNKEQEDDIQSQTNLKITNKLQKKGLSKYFKSQTQFEALTHSSISLHISNNPKLQAQEYYKSETDQIINIFGTSNQPFILQLNISVPYTRIYPVPLSIKLHALQGAIYLSNRKEYLLFGGISDSQEDINSQTFIYNQDDPYKKSGIVGKMITPRYAFGYRQIGEWIYAIGGGSSDEQGELIILSTCERLSIKKIPQVGLKEIVSWESIADLPFGLISSMALNYQNNLYIFGGMKANKERCQNILKYKQQENRWEQLQYNFPFGLEASSIYHRTEHEYIIFGGRVVNGDTKSIWGLTFIQGGNDCVFEQKGQMKQAKCLHHVYKPKHQNFIVIFGGEKQIFSCYDEQSLKQIQSDVLSGMKQMFVSSLNSLNDQSLKNYTVTMKE